MIDLEQPLLNRDGKETTRKAKVPKIVEKDGQEIETFELKEEKVLVGSMLRHACLREDGEEVEGAIRARYELFNKLNTDNTTPELAEEDIILLKKLVCQSFDVWHAGSLLEIINQ